MFKKKILSLQLDIKEQHMNTITIDNNIYNWAESYAKMHNITLKELAEKALMMVVKKKQGFKLKSEEELSPAIRSLIGIAEPNDKDLNGKDARMAYLEEKFSK